MSEPKTIHVSAQEKFCIERKTDSCGIVIFGASGDLSHRKLIPALFSLFRDGHLPKSFFVIGYARKYASDADFRKDVLATLRTSCKSIAQQKKFAAHLYAQPRLSSQETSFAELKKKLEGLAAKYKTGGNVIFYFSTPPSVFLSLSEGLQQVGLADSGSPKKDWTRVVFEKPFGYDLKSARELDHALRRIFDESQIYRIDHFLGKETVQNILIFRFANTIFEPIWNRHYIDHVQITAAEELGVEHRAAYYEKAGCLRDVFQNHLLQLLALVAMEPCQAFEPERYRDEKVQVIRSIRSINPADVDQCVVRGQYGGGKINGKRVPAYREEVGVHGHSEVETYVAMKLFVDNWRWKGVPFYLRAGKRLGSKNTEIAVQFKSIPHSMFRFVHSEAYSPNVLTFRIQPNEGISLSFEAKRPGPKLCMGTLCLNFDYSSVFKKPPMGAYERLLLDCMQGDQTLFVRPDMIELSWELVYTIFEGWQKEKRLSFPNYAAGSDGPEEACRLIKSDGREWRAL